MYGVPPEWLEKGPREGLGARSGGPEARHTHNRITINDIIITIMITSINNMSRIVYIYI